MLSLMLTPLIAIQSYRIWIKFIDEMVQEHDFAEKIGNLVCSG